MDIVDDHSFKEFYNTVFQTEMKRINQIASGNRFQRNKHTLDYFARFCTDYQYFDSALKKKTFLDTFKEIFIYLSDWEKGYTREIDESDPSSIEFRERRNSFRHMSRSFIGSITDIYCLAEQDHHDRHNSESLEVLNKFLTDYSLLLIDLIIYDYKGMVSNTLRELLNKTKPLDRLQYLCGEEWYQLGQRIQESKHLQSSPLLTIVISQSKPKKRHQPKLSSYHDDPPGYVKEFFSQVIDQEKLIAHSAELTMTVKDAELFAITNIIKDLFTELREGDEINVTDALTIIEENRKLKYLSSDELADYFKNMLLELPDFEYIRLKKAFRRKSSPIIELQSNIDAIFKQTVSSSLKTIEEDLSEIKDNQQELLTQTRQIQDFLELQFDVVIENQVKIEEYLFKKLGADFEKIRYLWNLYKDKQIRGKNFVKEASKILGTKFSRVFFDIMFFLK